MRKKKFILLRTRLGNEWPFHPQKTQYKNFVNPGTLQMDGLSTEDKTFENGRFKVDPRKNLYRKAAGSYSLVQKLNKPIYALATYGDKAYFIDTFGDCYAIDSSIHFLFGILSNPLYFAVRNDRIYALDKYSRMWVHDLEGEILNVSFLKENICTVVIKELYCSVTTDGNKRVIDYGKQCEMGSSSKEKKAIVCDRSFTILKEIQLDRMIEFGSDSIAYETNGNTTKISFQNSKENLAK